MITGWKNPNADESHQTDYGFPFAMPTRRYDAKRPTNLQFTFNTNDLRQTNRRVQLVPVVKRATSVSLQAKEKYSGVWRSVTHAHK